MKDLSSFFNRPHFTETFDYSYESPLQIGKNIEVDVNFEALPNAEVVLLGCGEMRGSKKHPKFGDAANVVRNAFYKLYNWHPQVTLADLGDIMQGASITDTKAALRVVLKELHAEGKIVIIIGGSQDLTLQQYEVFKQDEQTIDAIIIDRFIDLEEEESISDRSYLMDMLTAQPNYLRNYSHIGFQSYDVNPRMLETLDKLRFDFFRLGVARQDLEEMEPVFRQAQLLSVDLQALRKSEAMFLLDASPNGFFSDEMCQLMRYAGMAESLTSVGIYGYQPEFDVDEQGAKLVAQMIWYFLDGLRVRKMEAAMDDDAQFNFYNVHFSESASIFVKSKITNRWWMKMSDSTLIPCSYTDYQSAANNEIPERWLRAHERLV